MLRCAHLGRLVAEYGHEIRWISPENVCPYIKVQKNDDREAEWTAEAASRPTMRFLERGQQGAVATHASAH